jgi:DNA-binding transcriptional ArsR family regulator
MMLIIRDHASLRDLDVQDDAWIEQNDRGVQAGIASAADPEDDAMTSGSVRGRIEPGSLTALQAARSAIRYGSDRKHRGLNSDARTRIDSSITMRLLVGMQTSPDALFKSLADPTRRAIFERLARDGEQTVRVLTDHSGVSQPAISKHLGVLKLAGLVRDRRNGRQTHYSTQPQALAPLIDWMSLYGAFWRDRFDRLEVLLNRMDQ